MMLFIEKIIEDLREEIAEIREKMTWIVKAIAEYDEYTHKELIYFHIVLSMRIKDLNNHDDIIRKIDMQREICEDNIMKGVYEDCLSEEELEEYSQYSSRLELLTIRLENLWRCEITLKEREIKLDKELKKLDRIQEINESNDLSGFEFYAALHNVCESLSEDQQLMVSKDILIGIDMFETICLVHNGIEYSIVYDRKMEFIDDVICIGDVSFSTSLISDVEKFSEILPLFVKWVVSNDFLNHVQ